MTGYQSKKAAALDEDGMYLVHHTKRKDDDDDAQGYIAEYESALQKEYQRGYEAGKAAQQEPDAIGCQCAECGEWQKWTPSGMVCKNGHGGASGINQRLYTTPPAAQPAQASTNGLHTCPYAEEIRGDYETLCDCDKEATRQCAQDI